MRGSRGTSAANVIYHPVVHKTYTIAKKLNIRHHPDNFSHRPLVLFPEGMTLILGVGVGLFAILTLWVLVALIFLISLRIERKIGWVCIIAILLVSAFTYILLKVPRASEKPAPTDSKVYDRLFIWRLLILILCFISSIISIVGYIKFGLMGANRPVRITSWVFVFGSTFGTLAR